MKRLIEITLESEMDLVLSSQKFIRLAELLHLSLSTRSTFAGAVSEVVRVITDHTDTGVLTIGIAERDHRFKLVCNIFYPAFESVIDKSLFHFAKKLVPFFDTYVKDDLFFIEFSIGLPKSMNLTSLKIEKINAMLTNLGPISTYEELKNSKQVLIQKTELQKEELEASKYLNDLKTEFISMASHELKTPITILKAYGQLALSDKIKTLADAQKLIVKMNEQCGKLSTLALQLLDTAKIENGHLEYAMVSTDFNSYLSKLIEDLKHLVPDHHVTFNMGLTKGVMIDRLRMEQVLSNLLSNAAKYSDKATKIYINTNAKQELMILSISDEGIGISESGLTKIFDKFHREPEVVGKKSGLGMGMYIASKIVKAHGGEIWVESKIGKGSTFYISLPLT
ncbi:sensor histidine kinase [Pedobacter sp.]|uniref:sensor histidine kinase n=1 Tax=Pedobacter sp. TaxID=1411316 RepID=UPI003D7FD08E